VQELLKVASYMIGLLLLLLFFAQVFIEKMYTSLHKFYTASLRVTHIVVIGSIIFKSGRKVLISNINDLFGCVLD